MSRYMEKKKKPSLKPPKGKRSFKTIIFFVLIALVGWSLLSGYNAKKEEIPTVGISEVITRANNVEIAKIEVQGEQLYIYEKAEDEKPSQQSYMFSGSSLYEQGLTNKDVEVVVKPVDDGGGVWLDLMASLIPALLLMGFL